MKKHSAWHKSWKKENGSGIYIYILSYPVGLSVQGYEIEYFNCAKARCFFIVKSDSRASFYFTFFDLRTFQNHVPDLKIDEDQKLELII